MTNKFLTIALGAALGLSATAASAATLDDVKAKGFLQCGSNTGLAGFAAPNDAGEWTGLDVDTCRAIAAAIFDDPNAVKFTPLTAKERFTALQTGEVDVLVRNTTWTMSRDTTLGRTSPASTTMTARASWSASRSASLRLSSCPAPPSACRPAPPPS